MTWQQILLLALMTILASLAVWILGVERDRRERARLRREACLYHRWRQREGLGLVCDLCGKQPGQATITDPEWKE